METEKLTLRRYRHLSHHTKKVLMKKVLITIAVAVVITIAVDVGIVVGIRFGFNHDNGKHR